MAADSPTPAANAPSPYRYLRPYRVRIAVGVVMLLATNAMALTVPYLLGRTIDALGKPDPLDTVPTLALLMAAFAMAQAIARIVSRVSLFNAARMAEHDLRSDLFGHLMTLEPDYYRDHSTGDIMSRLTSDVHTVRALWGPAVLHLLNTSLLFFMALVLMLGIDPVLTLWALLPYPAIMLLGRFFGRLIHRSSRSVQEQLGALTTSVQEDLTGINIIKGYTLEGRRRAHFAAMSDTLMWRNMSLVKIRGSLLPLLGGLASLGTVVVIWVGGTAVVEGRIGIGQLIQFSAYLGLLLWPTMALGWMISLFQRGMASWSRLTDILLREPSIQSGERTLKDTSGPRGKLEIRDLTIEFDGRPVLDKVTIEIAPGSITAIVGRIGAGKSVLVETIPRLIDVPAGTVFLDGVDVTELTLSSLRHAVGYAPQESFLFSTTIGRNIAFGYQQSAESDDEVEVSNTQLLEAAHGAGLARDLEALPDGLETVVGERGITLSGGQRQRVALARALATSPRILVLDDSLSSVDAETEAEILGHLSDVLHGRTAIIISHRIAAVKRADQIVVLDEGRVAEVGTHSELLTGGGVYAELYRTQLDEHAASAARAGAE